MTAPLIAIGAVDPATGLFTPATLTGLGGGRFGLDIALAAGVVTLTASELEIGHVALKNDATEEHQTVAPDGQARDANHPFEGALQLFWDPVANVYQVPGINSENVAKAATPNRAAIKTAQKTVAASATAEQFAAQAVPDGFKVVVKANKGNTGQAFIGGSKVDAEDAAVRYPLEPDESISLAVQNFDDVWLAVTTNGDGFTAVVEV